METKGGELTSSEEVKSVRGCSCSAVLQNIP